MAGRIIGVIVCFAMALTGAIFAEGGEHGANPKGYVCGYTPHPVHIDGRLDDPAWRVAPWTGDFVDIEGDAKPAPRFRTRVKMLWDADYFYVGAELREPDVWATLTKRDTVIYRDNDFEVFIDPDGDSHEYYEFEMNALNTGWDLLLRKPYRDGGPPVDSWDIAGLKTAVYISGTLNNPADRDSGWSVELAFPWSALKEYAHRPVPPQEGDQWRVNFSRVEWLCDVVNGRYRKVPAKAEDNWVWSPQGVIDMHRPEVWGYVQFTCGEASAVSLRPDPALPARNALYAIYYAQRRHFEKWKRWASSLRELELEKEHEAGIVGGARLEIVAEGYVATVPLHLPDGTVVHWHIRQDSRIWADQADGAGVR